MTESGAKRQQHGLGVPAVLSAGLIAGLVFVVLEMVLVATAGGGSAWGPPRMMAAIAMGEEVLPGSDNPPTFDAGVNFYGMTAIFPWFENARNWITILAHIVFGAVAGGVYASMRS